MGRLSGTTNWIVVAIDEELRDYCKEHGIRHYYRPVEVRRQIWCTPPRPSRQKGSFLLSMCCLPFPLYLPTSYAAPCALHYTLPSGAHPLIPKP